MIIDELRRRGALALSTDESALRARLLSAPVRFYVGFDPTAPSLHHGHLMQLVTARRLQVAGHRPILLVGGATGLIGDPRPSAERALLDREVVAEWSAKLLAQISRFVDFEGPQSAIVVNNLEWTATLSALDYLRDIGKHFRIGRMLSKDAVQTRLASDAGISYTEFSYQILQANDFLELHRRHQCELQLGGSDQWGNITSGLDLASKVTGKSLHAIATALMVKSDGTKFGKSEGGSIWLDPAMTSPFEFFQFWMNLADEDAASLALSFSMRSLDELDVALREATVDTSARHAQRMLALEMTALVHGERTALSCRAAANVLYGGGSFESLDEAAVLTISDAIPVVPRVEGEPLELAFVRAGLVDSLSEYRRGLSQSAYAVNGRRITDEDVSLDAFAPNHGARLLQRGRRTFVVVAG